jgi:serine/threonine protein kinase
MLLCLLSGKRAHAESGHKSSRTRSRQKRYGQYLLLDLLGQGKLSEVWKAKDLLSDTLVAVKIYPHNEKTARMERYIQQEVEIAPSLKHPNIVQTLEARVYPDRTVIVTELAQVLLDTPPPLCVCPL